MFTGIIADVGRLLRLDRIPDGARLVVETALDLSEVALGDSIAVNGCCLTAVNLDGPRFSADVSRETLQRTALGELRPSSPVNLELALRLGDRLGGHVVQGHVDGVGRIVGRAQVGAGWDVTLELPEALLPTVVEKGSIAIDGISLTIARLDRRRVTISVIPHTWVETNLASLKVGSTVNIETDVIGKYVLRALTVRGAAPGSSPGSKNSLTIERLAELGYDVG